MCQRLNAGNIQIGRRWIKLCDPGTPDLIVILKHNETGYVLFVEAKREKGGIQSVDQKNFERKIKGMKNIYYVLATKTVDVAEVIHKIIYT